MTSFFAAFKTHADPELDRVKAAAIRYALAMLERPAQAYWLTITGPCGNGKTMLARLIKEFFKAYCQWDESGIIARQRPFGFYSFDNLADRWRAGEYSLTDAIVDKYFVVVDEVGAARDPSGYLADALFKLANRRLRKWTVWTSNLTIEQIATAIDPRISSRLIRDRNVVVNNKAPDYALR